MVNTVKVVEIYGRKVWIEKDFLGAAHVMIQHEDGESEPATYCTFHYDYRYTCNSGVHQAAVNIAKTLGAVEPLEIKSRPFNLSPKVTKEDFDWMAEHLKAKGISVVPDGWVPVPVEPTDLMLNDGEFAMNGEAKNVDAELCWNAMVSAAKGIS